MKLSENLTMKKIDLKFEKGSILTKEMLYELWAFPNESQNIEYNMYPDGILTGMELLEKDGDVFMKSGLVKYRGNVYRNDRDINLSGLVAQQKEEGIIEEQAEHQIMLVPEEPKFLDNRSTQRINAMCLKIFRVGQSEEGIFISQFRLPGKGRIKLFHDEDMKEISSPKFWNMIPCPYSCRGGTTFHPYIFEQIKRKIMKKSRYSALDYVLLNQIASEGKVNDAFMRMILRDKSKRLTISIDDRVAILKQFVDIIVQEEKFFQKEPEFGDNRSKTEPDSGKLLP